MNLSVLFSDIKPIQQDDGPHPVCSISYPGGFEEAMGYLRAVMKADERSDRALELTATCLQFNPANYTTWWFRRRCLASLSVSDDSKSKFKSESESNLTYFSPQIIKKDLKLASDLGGSNPKNYQIWYHRRNLLEWTFATAATRDAAAVTTKTSASSERESESNVGEDEDGDDNWGLVMDELEYVSTVLAEDAKNYHAWSHRQWILKTLNDDKLWEDELECVDDLIADDVRNNSAWNQRWFTSHKGLKSAPFSLEKAQAEISYVITKAAIDPYNESPWRYFIAIIKEQLRLTGDGIERVQFESFLEECETKVLQTKQDFEESTNKDGNECTHLISAYIDILEIKGDEKSCEIASGLSQELGNRYDPVRKKYWSMRTKQLLAKNTS